MTNELKSLASAPRRSCLRAKKVISLKAARKLWPVVSLLALGTRWPKRGTLTVLTGPAGFGPLFFTRLWSPRLGGSQPDVSF